MSATISSPPTRPAAARRAVPLRDQLPRTAVATNPIRDVVGRRSANGVASAIATMLLLSGCMTLPVPKAERALYLDLRKIVEMEEDAGWLRDAQHLDLGLEPALFSFCQVDAVSRQGLEAWLAEQVQHQGGTPEALYRTHGESLGAARAALSLKHTLALLRRAQAHASECPFWLKPTPSFAGRQYDADRFFMLAETTAFGTMVFPGAAPALGGGGRLLFGRGITSTASLALGVELAASGTLVPKNGQPLAAATTIATPLLLRFARLSKLFDIELAPVMSFETGRDAWPPGARITLGLGNAGLRTNTTFNYTVVYLGYELQPSRGMARTTHTLHLGVRLGLDWSPSP